MHKAMLVTHSNHESVQVICARLCQDHKVVHAHKITERRCFTGSCCRVCLGIRQAVDIVHKQEQLMPTWRVNPTPLLITRALLACARTSKHVLCPGPHPCWGGTSYIARGSPGRPRHAALVHPWALRAKPPRMGARNGPGVATGRGQCLRLGLGHT